MKNGNRQSETRNASVLPYTYSPAGSNWLYQKGSDIRGKTLNGNTASMSAASFTYDGYNRLATSTTAAETTTYTYNALGERIKKRNQNDLQAVFHYGNNGELLYERDQAGNTKAYVWLDGRPLARIDNDATIYYYHVDHLGTPQAMTNAAGAVVWKADYEPFGKVAIKVSTIENNLRFPGQYFDRETGLHYNYFRDYDPGSGRYVEADPIGLAGGVNLYAYVGGNPISYVDPLGLRQSSISPEAARAIGQAIISAAQAIWQARNPPQPVPTPAPAESRSRGKSDPVTLPIVNPGRDCDGKCKPCPPGARWWVSSPGHSHGNGYWHEIRYNQIPTTCECRPDRPSRGLEGQ